MCAVSIAIYLVVEAQPREKSGPPGKCCKSSAVIVLILLCTDLLLYKALVKAVGDACEDNGHHRVQAYPSYGPGRAGWRLAVVQVGNARAKAGSAGFWGWLLATASCVRPGGLVCPLPYGLGQ